MFYIFKLLQAINLRERAKADKLSDSLISRDVLLISNWAASYAFFFKN